MASGEQLLFSEVIRAERSVEIPGLTLRADYVTAAEEEALLAGVDSEPWQTDFRRRVQQYGVGYGEGLAAKWLREFPEWLRLLARRIAAEGLIDRYPENSVVNEYIPPVGIGPHKDYPAFGPTVVCVSLGSDIVMDFVEPKTGRREPVFVPRRSMWRITGPARSEWLHSISPRLTDKLDGRRRTRARRVSITFRTAADRAMVPQDRL